MKTFSRNLASLSLIGLILTSSSSLMANQSAHQFLDEFTADKITENVFVIHGPMGLPSKANFGFMNNPGFVLTSEGVVIIDPGSSAETGRAVLRKVDKVTSVPVVAVFNTHVHGDHWLGNGAIVEKYPDVLIYASQENITRNASGAGERWVNLIDNMTDGAAGETVAVGPNTPVTDQQIIPIGEYNFRIISNEKAHTETDIVVVVEELKTAFMGDNVFNGRLGQFEDSSFLGIVEILNKVLEMDIEYVVPGHGQSGSLDVVAKYHALVDTLYSSVDELYQKDLSDFEMKEPILEKLSNDYKDWSGISEDIGRAISHAYLEVEESSF